VRQRSPCTRERIYRHRRRPTSVRLRDTPRFCSGGHHAMAAVAAFAPESRPNLALERLAN
jgi:hypothetical protein